MNEQTYIITTLGGGTGTFTILNGLKKYPVDISAIVTMADSGGSTGKLRDEFGMLPVGDVRMALAALADEEYQNNLLRKLFLYRFDKGGEGLSGHNFGNLFLVAMEDILGSQEQAIRFASHVLRIRGTVLPVTSFDAQLVATYANGDQLIGETHIDEPPPEHDSSQRITELNLDPPAEITANAREAILKADAIILGPGDLYTSQLATIVVDGVGDTIQASKGVFIYIMNLMTKVGQTQGMTSQDHVNEVSRYVGRKPDYVLQNNAPIPVEVLRKYKDAENAEPLVDDLGTKQGIVREDLIATEEVKRQAGDALRRSLLRHDSDKLAAQVIKILNSHEK